MLQVFLDTMGQIGTDYCVIDGFAVNAYADPVVSLDLDIVIASTDIKALCKAVAVHFKIEHFPHSIKWRLIRIVRMLDTNSLPKKDLHMVQQETTENGSGVDKGLVAMFLKMSPEERLQANDKAARTVKELRDGYKQQRNHRPGPERIT